MSFGFPDAIGLFGSLCIVGAYAYNNMASTVNALLFNSVNLLGAIALTISLCFNFNLASFALEVVWITIALFGIGKALRAR